MSKATASAKNKTPMQKAMGQIKVAYIVAFISAAITLAVTIAAITGGRMLVQGISVFTFIDVVFLIILAVLLITLKSRVAAVVLFLYYIASQIIMRIANPGLGFPAMAIVFAMAYFSGVLGTFSYHKIKKQEAAENTFDSPDPPGNDWI